MIQGRVDRKEGEGGGGEGGNGEGETGMGKRGGVEVLARAGRGEGEMGRDQRKWETGKGAKGYRVF